MAAVSVSICIALSMLRAQREYAKEIARCLALKHQFRTFIYGFSYENSFDSCYISYKTNGTTLLEKFPESFLHFITNFQFSRSFLTSQAKCTSIKLFVVQVFSS